MVVHVPSGPRHYSRLVALEPEQLQPPPQPGPMLLHDPRRLQRRGASQGVAGGGRPPRVHVAPQQHIGGLISLHPSHGLPDPVETAEPLGPHLDAHRPPLQQPQQVLAALPGDVDHGYPAYLGYVLRDGVPPHRLHRPPVQRPYGAGVAYHYLANGALQHPRHVVLPRPRRRLAEVDEHDLVHRVHLLIVLQPSAADVHKLALHRCGRALSESDTVQSPLLWLQHLHLGIEDLGEPQPRLELGGRRPDTIPLQRLHDVVDGPLVYRRPRELLPLAREPLNVLPAPLLRDIRQHVSLKICENHVQPLYASMNASLIG